jgi:poly(A) polymerase
MRGAKAASPTRLGNRQWLDDDAVQAVFDALEAANGTARVAGGAVRNALLGSEITDIDIATNLRPAQVVSAFKKAGIKTAATGLAHGTLTAIVEAGDAVRTFEVTTLRVDVEAHGRHATVAFTDDWTADAARRDFTMNALYCDRDGTVFDPIGGYRDVQARHVAFVGDPGARIKEDYLRILRFFRIHAVYGEGPLDSAGLAACLAHAAGLGTLSAERVRQETWKLLVARRAVEVVGEIQRDGIAERILGRTADFERFRCVVAMEASAGASPDPLLRLAALALTGADDVAALRGRFVLTNIETTRLARLVGDRERLRRDMGAALPRRALYGLGARGYRDAVLYDLSADGGCDTIKAVELLRLPDVWPVPLFPLSGRDVVACGVPSGAQVGRILDTLEAEWIDSDFALDEAALRQRLAELAESG